MRFMQPYRSSMAALQDSAGNLLPLHHRKRLSTPQRLVRYCLGWWAPKDKKQRDKFSEYVREWMRLVITTQRYGRSEAPLKSPVRVCEDNADSTTGRLPTASSLSSLLGARPSQRTVPSTNADTAQPRTGTGPQQGFPGHTHDPRKADVAQQLPREVPWQMRKRLATIHKTATGRQQRSLLSNTLFSRRHVPMLKWFRALGLFADSPDGISARQLKKQLKIGSYATALDMLGAIRALVPRLQPVLDGHVQVDDLRVSSVWASLRTRDPDNEPRLLIAVESKPRTRRRVLIQLVRDPIESARRLRPLLHTRARVENPPDARFGFLAGYGAHKTVSRPSGNDSEKLLPDCQDVADGLTKWLRRIHRRPPSIDMLQPYLDEFAFRVNVGGKRHRRQTLATLIYLAVGMKPVDSVADDSLGRIDI